MHSKTASKALVIVPQFALCEVFVPPLRFVIETENMQMLPRRSPSKNYPGKKSDSPCFPCPDLQRISPVKERRSLTRHPSPIRSDPRAEISTSNNKAKSLGIPFHAASLLFILYVRKSDGESLMTLTSLGLE